MKDKEIVEMLKNGPTETIVLSNEDFDRMMEIIENPPEPSEKLKELFAKYKGCGDD